MIAERAHAVAGADDGALELAVEALLLELERLRAEPSDERADDQQES